ncbi:anti-sigma factor RsiW [Kitasatospora gansuensis]|uniref:Anti-sigma factor RsiW n=1 Tax=Kitasatospora gansuensis TaxID=258050 RepID=A0A7W7S9K3_9ACTN|nr:zf-HC2 domain-containing protein [Kitasatospora gansuensis]MBB4946389.1 anti-sigma factor RsiW [Kitasatospora gansuensis]
MSVEHASAQLIGDYVRGEAELPADTLWALEAHLEGCAQCRARLAATEAPGLATLLDTVRAGLEPQLAAAVQAPSRRRRPRWVSAWLTPVPAPWLAMTVGVTLLALLLDEAGPLDLFGGTPLLLLTAPVLPLCAVAASWSRGLDPAYEITASTARAGLPLLLRRTTAVLVTVLPLLLVAGRLTGAMTAAQWLLPSLAFTSAALALGSVIGVTRAAAALVAAWGAVLAVSVWAGGSAPLTLRSEQLPLWGLVLALGCGAVIARRGAYAVPRNLR